MSSSEVILEREIPSQTEIGRKEVLRRIVSLFACDRFGDFRKDARFLLALVTKGSFGRSSLFWHAFGFELSVVRFILTLATKRSFGRSSFILACVRSGAFSHCSSVHLGSGHKKVLRHIVSFFRMRSVWRPSLFSSVHFDCLGPCGGSGSRRLS